MGGFKSGLVHRALHPGGEGLIGDLAVDRRAAGVAGERDGQYVVTALEGGENKLQLRHVSLRPCTQTSADPEPPRWEAVKAASMPRDRSGSLKGG